MQRILIATFACVVACTGARCEQAPPDAMGRVTAIGTATAYVPPDAATVTISVASERVAAWQATDDLSRKAAAVVLDVLSRGVPKSAIRTESVDLVRTFEPNGVPPRVPRGYVATTTVTLDVADAGKVGDIVRHLLDKGVEVRDVSFRVTDEDDRTIALHAVAVKDALRKATAEASALGKRLGRLVAITEDRRALGGKERAGRDHVGMRLESGAVPLVASVSATWEIADSSPELAVGHPPAGKP